MLLKKFAPLSLNKCYWATVFTDHKLKNALAMVDAFIFAKDTSIGQRVQ